MRRKHVPQPKPKWQPHDAKGTTPLTPTVRGKLRVSLSFLSQRVFSKCMYTTQDNRAVTTTIEFIALNLIKGNETTGYLQPRVCMHIDACLITECIGGCVGVYIQKSVI